MSNLFKKVIGSLGCEDEIGWARVANPLSFYLRNLALLGVILALWFRVELGLYAVLLFLGSLILARVSILVPPFRQQNNWHAEAIAGERFIVCNGLKSVTASDRDRLVFLKGVEAINLLALVFGLIVLKGDGILITTIIFFLLRLALLLTLRRMSRVSTV